MLLPKPFAAESGCTRIGSHNCFVFKSRPWIENLADENQAFDPSARLPIRFGPGLLVTAAFIGPGTVVTASKAGAFFGYGLMWTIVFAVVGASVLQLLAARIGIIYGHGLGERLRSGLGSSGWFPVVAILIIAALGIGNSAYQTGNITGAATALNGLLGGQMWWWALSIGIIAALIVTIPSFQLLRNTLVSMVVVLSLAFLLTAILSTESLASSIAAANIRAADPEKLTFTLALIGTTIVPYNLFLHSSGAAENWQGCDTGKALRASTWDTLVSIGLGGLVTAAIMSTAYSAFYVRGAAIESIGDIALQLRPAVGAWSSIFFSLGLFAAGLTSAITAPLATAYAVGGVLGWKTKLGKGRFRCVAYTVIAIGTLLACLSGEAPAETIVFAQVTNSLLLPIVAIYLLWAASQRQALEKPATWFLVAGLLVVGCVLGLTAWKFAKLLL